MSFAKGYIMRSSGLGLGHAYAGEDGFVDLDEDSVAAGEYGSVGGLDLGLVEELSSFSAQVTAFELKRLKEGDGLEVVDLHVAGDGEDIERAVDLAHGLVEKSGDDASMDVAGWAFVEAVELEVR